MFLGQWLIFPQFVDIWLRHCGPRFELGPGVVAEGGVTSQPIVEHLDVFEDVLCGLFARPVPAMIHEFALQGAEEALDTGIVSTSAGGAHAGGDAVGGEQLMVSRGGILAPRSEWGSSPASGARWWIAIVRACCVTSTVNRRVSRFTLTGHR